jgi:ParB-like chromosome segregation protein Spo0J
VVVDGHLRQIREIEIGQCDLRYAHTRIERPKESLALAASVERIGQIVPVIVTTAFVLLDGYLRVKALKHLGRDTVMAEIWDYTEEEALVEILARSHGRKWDVIEEAALLAELHDRCRLSQERIASMVGRTQGWVSSRLALYGALTDDMRELIRTGAVSTWTATRVIAPIARAIPEHGKALSERLSTVSLSTREMAQFFRHYHKATRRQRDAMVHDPVLFVKSLYARQEALDARALKEGPEGTWCKDLNVVTHILARLFTRVPTLFYEGQSQLDRRVLLTAFEESERQFMELEREIRRYDDNRREQAGHYESSRTGCPHPADRRDPEDLPEHRQAGGPGGVAGHPTQALSPRGPLIAYP